MRLLLVEDDQVLGSAIRDHLAEAGHGVDWVQTIADADAALATVDYELALLDLTLPDGQGLDLLRRLRDRGVRLPVIIATAQDQVSVRIEGLNSGADDYLVKPFNLAELGARIVAVSRRYSGNGAAVQKFGAIEIDAARRIVRSAGSSVPLSAREWAVLERLVVRPGAIVTRAEIEDSLYSFGSEVESNAVEVYVSRLRKKLGRDLVQTIRGLGYQVQQ